MRASPTDAFWPSGETDSLVAPFIAHKRPVQLLLLGSAPHIQLLGLDVTRAPCVATDGSTTRCWINHADNRHYVCPEAATHNHTPSARQCMTQRMLSCLSAVPDYSACSSGSWPSSQKFSVSVLHCRSANRQTPSCRMPAAYVPLEQRGHTFLQCRTRRVRRVRCKGPDRCIIHEPALHASALFTCPVFIMYERTGRTRFGGTALHRCWVF